MKSTISALAFGLALCTAAHAQQVTQAEAPVPPTTYVSPLAGYRPAPPADRTPAANWRAANAAVVTSGHGGHQMHKASPQPKEEPKTPPPQEHHHEH